MTDEQRKLLAEIDRGDLIREIQQRHACSLLVLLVTDANNDEGAEVYRNGGFYTAVGLSEAARERPAAAGEGVTDEDDEDWSNV